MPSTSPPKTTGRPITIDDLYAFRLVGEPGISPDGTRVAVAVTAIDKDADEYRAALWVFSIDGSISTRLTSGRWLDAAPRWSPDGNWIAFTSNRTGERPQIWLLPTAGGEARQVTTLEHGAGEHAWSPDSRHLVFTTRGGPDEEAHDSDVRVITSARYKFDGQGFLEGKTRQVFTIDALTEGADPIQLTSGTFDHATPAWSPAGHEIAFLANRRPDWEVRSEKDIWTVPATGGEPRRLTDGLGAYGTIAWSPDGTSIATTGNRVQTGIVQNARLFIIPSSGGDMAKLGSSLDRHIGDATMSGPGASFSGPALRWLPDGSAVLAPVSSEGSTTIHEFPISGPATRQWTADGYHVAAFDIDASGRVLATAATDASAPFEIVAWRSARPSALTSFNAEWRNEVAVLRPEEFWLDVGGDRVQGWLIRPAGNTPEGPPVPLILNVHGGPHAQFGPAFFHELQVYAARGYALVFINPHGSMGYAETFARSVAGAWGVADSADFLAAIDHVVALGGIDGDRVGITGGSYGGYITNWLLGTSDRFKVGVTDRSISNMISMYGTDDISLVSLDPELGTPWENFQRYWDMSPLKHVANITAPLLIIHSEHDYRCPMEQAEQLFIALKRLGRTTEFVRFPDESHGLGRSGKPKHRVERLERTLGWFEKHL